MTVGSLLAHIPDAASGKRFRAALNISPFDRNRTDQRVTPLSVEKKKRKKTALTGFEPVTLIPGFKSLTTSLPEISLKMSGRNKFILPLRAEKLLPSRARILISSKLSIGIWSSTKITAYLTLVAILLYHCLTVVKFLEHTNFYSLHKYLYSYPQA